MLQPAPDFLHFAYGSNMSSRTLTAPGRAPSATRVTFGYVPGRRLTFDKFSTRDRSVEHVLVGAAENGLPSGYVKAIRQIPTVVDENERRATKERAPPYG